LLALNIGSDVTIAIPELKDFSQDIEENQVCFSGERSYGISRESGTLSIELGSGRWEKVVAHFSRLPAGIPGLDNNLEKHHEVFAQEKWSVVSNLSPVEIELLPGASSMTVPRHHMYAQDEQILEEKVKEMQDKGIVERVKSSKPVFPFFIARGKSCSSSRKAKKRSAVD
jgi:hypothetical protein